MQLRYDAQMTDEVGAPRYEQVAERIREHIRRGKLRAGDKLPGYRGLAGEHDVSPGTAQTTLRVLQDEGWLSSTPSVGYFVKGIADEPATSNPNAVSETLDELQAAVADLRHRVEQIEGRTGRV